MTPGGTAELIIPNYNDPYCGNSDVIVVHQLDGTFTVFGASCYHACCAPKVFNGYILCPCHGASWDLNGVSNSQSIPSGPLPA